MKSEVSNLPVSSQPEVTASPAEWPMQAGSEVVAGQRGEAPGSHAELRPLGIRHNFLGGRGSLYVAAVQCGAGGGGRYFPLTPGAGWRAPDLGGCRSGLRDSTIAGCSGGQCSALHSTLLLVHCSVTLYAYSLVLYVVQCTDYSVPITVYSEQQTAYSVH